ncbi:MAG: DNA polymerase III subunit beta, partial [Chloroflexi bacterium]|nr:DNA polymerase III subunit beta [Chloroflexota bacterium]
LARGLDIVGRAVAVRSTLPTRSVGHVALSTTADGRLQLAATNLSLGIRTTITAQVDQPGATTIPAALLGDLVKALPAAPVALTLNERTETLQVVCERYTTNIKGISATDFPLIPTAEGQPVLQIDPGLLGQMISQVAFAAADDEARPILTGALVALAGNTLTMATADGFRLSVRDARFEVAAAANFTTVIPGKALHELGRILAGVTEPVQIWLTRNQVVFRAGATELVSSLIEGQYPNYEAIVPTSCTVRARLSRSQLLQATKIANLFTSDGKNGGGIILTLTPGIDLQPGRVVLAANANQVGDNHNEVEAVVAGLDAGQSTQVVVNARFLGQVLGAVTAEEVALELTTPLAPVALKAVGEDGFLHVIMPMHLNEVQQAA